METKNLLEQYLIQAIESLKSAEEIADDIFSFFVEGFDLPFVEKSEELS